MFARPSGPRVRTLLGCVLFAITPCSLAAHELQESAVTLVVRDGGALELRVVCTWSRLLMDAPRAVTNADDRRTALMRLAAEPAAVFASRYDRLRRSLVAGIVARLADGSTRPFASWQWPGAANVQDALRQEMMAEATGGDRNHHASRLMATARLVLGPRAESVSLALPRSLGPVLFTSIRPNEQWLAPAQSSPTVPLRRP
jgi:hypothetical protein